MTLLAPASLWTLAALALPLAIHLWRRPPRTVRLGSLRFLRSRARRWQNLRWREYVLLAARLGLLAALALLLSRPVWRRPPPKHPARWALLDPAAALAGPSLDRLHALQAHGYETRLLAPGFPAANARSPGRPDLWSLLREADATLPAGSSLAVFSPGRLASLRGVRPMLVRCRVEWVNTPASAAPAVASPLPAPSARPLTVQVLHDADRAGDARYVAAALHAVSQADQRALTITVASTHTAVTTTDWIFWLGAQPVPEVVASHATNVFDDAPTATADATSGWIVPQPGGFPLDPPVRLWRRVPPTDGSVLWTDGYGQPLLTRTVDAHGTRWHFASRFSLSWNDLPLGTALPASLRALLFADVRPVENDDQRLVDPSQCLPAEAPAGAAPPAYLPGAEHDTRPLLWLLAALLFCVERSLSHRRPARDTVATASPAPKAEPVLSR